MPASDHETPDLPDPNPPVPRFKRRKTTHTKRAHGDALGTAGTATAIVNDDARTDAPTLAPTAAALPTQLSDDNEDEDGVLGLREALKSRKRAREQQRGRGIVVVENGGRGDAGGDAGGKDGARKEEAGLRYASRFVKQTGQVVDTGDKEMTAYIEARLAEQHHVKYGTPIPAHLAALVGANSSSNKNTSFTASTTTSTTTSTTSKPPQNTTPSATAARNGKLEEVALPTPTPPNPPTANPKPRVRLRRDGTPFRPRRQRRTSNDLRRDALVESILSESRIEYFAPPATSGDGTQGEAALLTEEEMLRQFEDEYRDAAEARRPNPLPPAGKAGAAGDAAKGPKLGGSRSARAAMAAREKEKNPGSKRNDTIINDGRVLEPWEWRAMRGEGGGKPWYAK